MLMLFIGLLFLVHTAGYQIKIKMSLREIIIKPLHLTNQHTVFDYHITHLIYKKICAFVMAGSLHEI